MIKARRLLILCFTLILAAGGLSLKAQGLLQKSITIEVRQQPLIKVLDAISKQGNFSFSFNGRLLSKDSLVTLSVVDEPVNTVLKRVFQNRYEFEEHKNYIIITPALAHLVLVSTDLTKDDNTYSVSGFVVNEQTGERLMNVSVYQKAVLAATLTDEHGYFRLKFKAYNQGSIAITASKRLYRDTTMFFLEEVPVASRNDEAYYKNAAEQSNSVESTGLGRLFISGRQMIQSLNIPDFFAKRPFQVSLTPGLSTHGMFSPQVVNMFSVNVAGGYTAGVNGFELGGLFNINKQNSRYLQLAGIFNLVGGNVTGVQLAGAHNRALDTVRGAQISLFSNKAETQLSGFQLSALNNQTYVLKGLQIGLVNRADTSYGASVGLINIVGNGFYKIIYSANDVANTNVTLKTGTHAFYSTLITSANFSPDNKFYAFGLGIGHDFMFGPRFYVSAETAFLFANTGLWDDRWLQSKLLLNLQLSEKISVMAGPTYNHYNHSGSSHINGYKNITNIPDYSAYASAGHQTRSWLGWEAGLAFNGVFKHQQKRAGDAHAWYLGAAITAGKGWDEPYRLVTGAELSLQRDLDGGLTGTLSTGYTHIAVQSNYSAFSYDLTEAFVNPINIIPVKAGARIKTGNTFYFAGEIGGAFAGGEPYRIVSNDPQYIPIATFGSYRAFMYAVSAGFSFQNGIETGLKFEDYGLQSQYKQFALRLGYRLKLSK